MDHLMRIAIREYLYSTLCELLLDALAAEHGMRLVSTQSAGQWLDERVARVEYAGGPGGCGRDSSACASALTPLETACCNR